MISTEVPPFPVSSPGTYVTQQRLQIDVVSGHGFQSTLPGLLNHKRLM